MSWRERFPWRVYGRYGLAVLLTLASIQAGAATADGEYLTLRTVTAMLCGLALLTPRAHWLAAPLLATVAVGLWGWPMMPLLLLALFDLAAHRRTAVALGSSAAVVAANALLRPEYSVFTPRSGLYLLAAVLGGLWIGNRRRLVHALNAQVEHLRIERELREEAARAAERSRIAAEMHDVLAHRLSLIALHSGVLTNKSDTLPAMVAERLALLRTASTEALGDLRNVLHALHDPHIATAEGPSASVLGDVCELVEQAHTAGQQVESNVVGRPEQVPATHRLAVYRLVQEALTNARKHAAGGPVTVRIDYGPPATVVEVANSPGTAAAGTPSSGFGLVGLRERVTALGGRMDAGPQGGGTWRLDARIPCPADAGWNGIRT